MAEFWVFVGGEISPRLPAKHPSPLFFSPAAVSALPPTTLQHRDLQHHTSSAALKIIAIWSVTRNEVPLYSWNPPTIAITHSPISNELVFPQRNSTLIKRWEGTQRPSKPKTVFSSVPIWEEFPVLFGSEERFLGL